MTANFSTNELIALERQIEKSTELLLTSPDQLNHVYEIDNCVQWIQKNGFKKVCLQFPDHLLGDASEVALCLQKQLGQTVYVLGDTAYESCCIDYVAAAHVDADAIVHFGPVCFSKPADTIPCLHVYEKHKLDINKLVNIVKATVSDPTIVLDTPYATHLKAVQQVFDHTLIITDEFEPGHAVTIVICDNMRKILNFKLSSRNWHNDLFYYNPTTAALTNYDEDPKVIKRRRFLVEKIKDSETFGIIIGTVAVRNYLSVIERTKKLIRVHRKKYHVISVGKPTVTKLANFPEIEVYVVIACGMNEIYDSREFYKPIVTPYDLEMALNPRWADARFSFDFNSYLTTDFDVTEEDVAGIQNDVSLISGKLRGRSEHVIDEIGSELAIRNDGTVALNTNFGAGFLSQRSWKGLEQNLGCDKPAVVSEGRRGIAQGYKNEDK